MSEGGQRVVCWGTVSDSASCTHASFAVRKHARQLLLSPTLNHPLLSDSSLAYWWLIFPCFSIGSVVFMQLTILQSVFHFFKDSCCDNLVQIIMA